MPANYDHTTWFYDALSRLVFGRSIRRAQISLLPFIPANSKVLIAGGGTGWILEELSKVHSSGLEIIYVEISANMIALAQKQHALNNKVIFINQPVEEVDLSDAVDVVITPFLFDNFTPPAAAQLFNHLDKQLKPGGLWLYTDFQLAGRWWHKAMLKSMYLFFRMFKAVEVSELPDVATLFRQYGYQPLQHATFYGDFIEALATRKGKNK